MADFSGLISLTDFIDHLPGIAPRKARRLIWPNDRERFELFVERGKPDDFDLRHYSEILTPTEATDIHTFYHPYYASAKICIGPIAAAAILAAYTARRLPMKTKGTVPEVAPEAEAYVARRDELLAVIEDRSRRKRALDDPSLVLEKDLDDLSFLSDLFYRHCKGSGSMTLDGITVSKTLHGPYKTNSGKNQSWSSYFTWTGSDGQKRSSGSTSPQASNRRNDPERNWGLPE